MTHVVNTKLLPKLQRYGAFDISACFNCGNCTAICPLSTEKESFPRRMIRYAQIGMEKRLLSTPNLWLCYYCGECSATCPRQAEPGEFMASTRRYAIAQNDLTGLSHIFYTRPKTSIALMGLLGIILAIFFWNLGSIDENEIKLFDFVPLIWIDFIGAVAVGFAVIVFLIGVFRTTMSINQAYQIQADSTISKASIIRRLTKGIFTTAFVDVMAQTRFLECEDDKLPWFLQRWLLHMTIFWGFVGLAAATTLNFLFKEPEEIVEITHPIRMLGIISGLLMMYGTTIYIVFRIWKSNNYFSHSMASDWIFLALIWLTGVTGFLLTSTYYVEIPPLWAYLFFVAHLVVVVELAVFAPFTKMAHIIYRPLALWLSKGFEK